jgi:hypothetical protein
MICGFSVCFFLFCISGGNFCAGYDLGELSGFSPTDNLPDDHLIANGRGPMVSDVADFRAE